MNIKKYNKFFEDKEQKELSDDVEDVRNDIEIEIDGEKVKSGDYYIDDVLDVIVTKDEGDEDKNESASSITTHADLSMKETKRGDIIWITALLRKRGTTSFTSPAKQGVLKLRVVDIYYGLRYLNKVINK